jgi:adenine-specific DNA-methyltransferase
MGTKRDQALFLAETIAAAYPEAIVIDAFSGTCAVAQALCPSHVVWANDIHNFAGIVARAVLTNPLPKPTLQEATSELKKPFRKNRDDLLAMLHQELKLEERALVAALDADDWVPMSQLHGRSEGLAPFSPDKYRSHPTLTPYALFTILYRHTYFGLRQCIELDSLRYAIDCARSDHRAFYMWALFRTASHCAAAPGHFAQYLTPRDTSNTKLIAKYRSRGVWSRFVSEYRSLSIPPRHSRERNAVFTESASFFVSGLPALLDGSQGVVYADPPYSRAQYSRYYHLLETLALYDYPLVQYKGRYRDGRFNTDFSRAGRVEGAMDDFVSRAAAASLPLFLSYPSNGLFVKRGGDLMGMLRKHYSRVRCISEQPMEHSTLGGAPGTASIPVTEVLYCGEMA